MMPNETYCSVIGVTDGNLRDNLLFTGDVISNPIGAAVEEKAIELFEGYCKTLGYDELDHSGINEMVEEGYLCTNDHRIQVYLNWPVVQNPSK